MNIIIQAFVVLEAVYAKLSHMFKKIFIIFTAIIILILSVSFYYFKAINNPTGTPGQERDFEITGGQSLEDIAAKLESEGLISSAIWFKLYVWQQDWTGKLKAGQYKFKTDSNIIEIARTLSTGDTLGKEIEVLIKEGQNIREAAVTFREKGLFNEEDFFKVAGYPMIDYRTAAAPPEPKDFSDIFNFLEDKPSFVGLEGYLFPDTYRFYKDARPEEVVMKMLGNFDKKLTQSMRDEISRQGKTIYEIVTMASLIEKEVRSDEDMKIVSGIFWNRINEGQRLQSCASLAYVLGVNKPQYSYEDTQVESPYNTYRNDGLTPGPITNPGLKAIEAAIYPEQTEYKYFLTATDGTTVFAKTYNEHLRNKEKYLR